MRYTAITSIEKIRKFICDFFDLEIAKRTKIEITPDKYGYMKIVLLPLDSHAKASLECLFQHGRLFQQRWNLVFTKSYEELLC